MPVERFTKIVRKALQFQGRVKDTLPGYSLALLEVSEKGTLRVSVSNPGSGTRIMAPTTSHVAGAVAVAHEHIDRATGNLPPRGDVSIAVAGKNLQLSLGSVRFRIPYTDPEDFVSIPTPPAEGWFDVRPESISEIVSHLSWALGAQEYQPQLTGVHLTSDFSETTNGHTMAQKRPGILPSGEVIVPGDTWTQLRAFVDETPKGLRAHVADRSIWLRSQSWAVFSRLLDARFPDTSGLVFDVGDDGVHDFRGRKLPVHWIHVNRLALLSAVGRIVGTSIKPEEKKIGAAARFLVNGDGAMRIVSHYHGTEGGSGVIDVEEAVQWAEGSVTADHLDGFESLSSVSAYGYYLKQALSSLRGDVVRMMWGDTSVPGLIAPIQFHDEESGAAALVMPRML